MAGSAKRTPAESVRPPWPGGRIPRATCTGLAALAFLVLFGEFLCRVERYAIQRSGARYLEAHPNLYTRNRETTEAYASPLWLEPWVRYRPGARFVATVGGVRHSVVINSLGYRDREFTERKAGGILRVACIGGSTTVQGVANEETYPALLEQDLRARLGREMALEVLNLGISGAWSGYWLERQEELLRFEPDVVVQYEGANDILWHHLPAFGERNQWESRLYRSMLLRRLLPLAPERFDDYLAVSVENVRRLHAVLEKHGIQHVIGTFAAPDETLATPEFRAYLDFDMAAEWGGGRIRLLGYREYRKLLDQYNLQVGLMARAEALPVARVDERLRDPALFLDICHMTPEGIRELARAFLPVVGETLAACRKAGSPPGVQAAPDGGALIRRGP